MKMRNTIKILIPILLLAPILSSGTEYRFFDVLSTEPDILSEAENDLKWLLEHIDDHVLKSYAVVSSNSEIPIELDRTYRLEYDPTDGGPRETRDVGLQISIDELEGDSISLTYKDVKVERWASMGESQDRVFPMFATYEFNTRVSFREQDLVLLGVSSRDAQHRLLIVERIVEPAEGDNSE